MVAKFVAMGVVAGLLMAATSPSYACSCPKEQMIKKYGTVSMLGPKLPLPPPLPAAKGGQS